ncbi:MULTISPECIES: MFS transporter [Microbacterium]|uniref:MFS transporter n=1 Tax=Microbacterium hominis TaxID=162426 RepID=A0A2K9DZ54_9MICO|nr:MULTISPECIES: MFS transporter [Microbacterium]AUG31164.1 MFS transporter [Microbacterium hominis]QOC27483.1 MFS transporter [Microbacterium hominis]QOC30324.1 MFS transporter [Microbacterium hominis]QYF99265.1 MFS transporter [Microbacterium sp. PAMC21962]
MDAATVGRVQRRTVGVLAAGQVLGGIAFGATVSLGALLAADLSGQEALSGLATASVTLGASFCAIPLARLAARRGRRVALTLGNLFALVGIAVVITAAAVRSFPLLIVGVILIGAGNAGNLQSRFAATDLAPAERRGRDLGTVVWATTVGGVLGPLLLTPGEAVGSALGMPPLTGSYAFSIVAQLAAFVLYVVALRPDPLVLAQRLARSGEARRERIVEVDRPVAARYAVFAVAGSHVVMASVMAMTPIHLAHLAPDHVTVVVGTTIALHVFGMYGLSPLFGVLADRWGRIATILLGQALLAAALVLAAVAPDSQWAVLVALFLLGAGWSAATVSGAALLTESSLTALRPRRQGLSDTIMTFSAAVGAVLAGVVLSQVGYGGLALVALVVVAAVTVLSPYARRA